MKKLLFVAIAAFIATPAFAIDFTQKIVGDDDKPMCIAVEKDGSCARELTLGIAVRNAIDAQVNLQGLSPEEKDRRGELSQGLIGATNPKLLESDKKMIRTAIGNAYAPSVIHKLWMLLDADDTVPKK